MGPREPVERPSDLHASIPFPPMEAELVRELPEGDEWQYEPKWDGFRGLLENGTGELRLWSRNARPLLRYFPELRPLDKLLPRLSALDGEIVIERDGVLDFDAMQTRLHPAESRVNKLSAEIPARFIAFDVLVWKGVEAWHEPLSKRRARLERSAKRFELSPASRERKEALGWLDRFEAIGLDGVIAKRRDAPYLPGSRDGVVKVKPERTADCVVIGVRWKSKPDRLATLLLGLYGDDGEIDYVGTAAARRGREARRPAPRERAGAPVVRAEPVGQRRARRVASPTRARRRGALRQGSVEPLPARDEAHPLPRRQGPEEVHVARGEAAGAGQGLHRGVARLEAHRARK
jgi:ATP-dependent DNA ligase